MRHIKVVEEILLMSDLSGKNCLFIHFVHIPLVLRGKKPSEKRYNHQSHIFKALQQFTSCEQRWIKWDASEHVILSVHGHYQTEGSTWSKTWGEHFLGRWVSDVFCLKHPHSPASLYRHPSRSRCVPLKRFENGCNFSSLKWILLLCLCSFGVHFWTAVSTVGACTRPVRSGAATVSHAHNGH